MDDLYFYEKCLRERNYEVFMPLLVGSYSEEFTQKDEIYNIVNYERQYTRFMKDLLAARFSLSLYTNKPYFLGFGSSAIVYNVLDSKGRMYAAKFTWGESDFSKEIGSYYLIQYHKASHLFPLLHFSYFEHQPKYMDYEPILRERREEEKGEEEDNRFVLIQGFGILIQDKVDMTLAQWLKKNKATPEIIHNFKQVCGELEYLDLVHADLTFENISINKQSLKLGFLDYPDVAPFKKKKARDEFHERYTHFLGKLEEDQGQKTSI